MKTLQRSIRMGLLCLIALLLSNTLVAQTSLKGNVTDESNGEPILFGNVALLQNGILIIGVETDFDGNYNITNIDPGTYDVEVSYVGYSPQRVEGVIVYEDKVNRLDIQLGAGINLTEVVVVEYNIPLIDIDNTTQGGIVTSNQIRTLPTKNINGLAATTAGVAPHKKGKNLTVRGGRSSSTDYYVDGIRVRSNNLPPNAMIEEVEELQLQEAAGQLTAGEWKDLDNWSFWNDLSKNTDYNKYQKHWSFFPQNRYAVQISGAQKQAVSDATVYLLDKDGQTIWQTKTDNQGRAELWTGIFGGSEQVERLKIESGDYQMTTRNIRLFTEAGINHYTIPVACEQTPILDLMFAVDATGSMSDEIEFLKAELSDVLQRVAEENPDLSIRTSAVFYRDRDHDPAIQVEVSPFSDNSSEILKFISTQKAVGGNSTPEAVDLGLEAALQQTWSPRAVSRILFLILDAPPHHNDASNASIQKSIQQAAEQGIKIIPVSASGIDKSTEFLMKYFSIITNSTYTFLTDHSGIGDKHLKPTAKSYNVETLNELMLRLILENTEVKTCDPDIAVTAEEQLALFDASFYQKDKNLAKAIKIYPNPAQNDVNIDLNTDVDGIQLYDKKGQLLRTLTNVPQSNTLHNIQDLPSGTYILSFIKDGKVASKKLVVAKD